MNLIIPMAGRGKRIRPHSLTIPKPLLPVAGKPIVQRLAEDIIESVDTKIDNIGFVIGDFGKEVEEQLLRIADQLGAKGHIFHQEQPLGTAHAILCAEPLMDDRVIVAFADTLFKADFKIDPEQDGIIWVQKVDDPSSFGVVKVNDEGIITEMVEKPETPVSDLAIIGIYYFKNGPMLRDDIQHIIDKDIKDKGEYQLTTSMENLKNAGQRFTVGQVDEWLDCGNKDIFVYTNSRVLEHLKAKGRELVDPSVEQTNSIIVPPCFVAEGVTLENAVIGPHVSIGKNTTIKNAVIKNSVIQEDTFIENKIFSNSMVSNHVELKGKQEDLSIGDHTTITHDS